MNKWKNKEEFKTRVREWAEKLDIEIKTVSIRQMNNKWASYTQRNDLLLFNSDLLGFDKAIGDYVIVHELCHLKEFNHSKKYWDLVEKAIPNYKILRKQARRFVIKSH